MKEGDAGPTEQSHWRDRAFRGKVGGLGPGGGNTLGFVFAATRRGGGERRRKGKEQKERRGNGRLWPASCSRPNLHVRIPTMPAKLQGGKKRGGGEKRPGPRDGQSRNQGEGAAVQRIPVETPGPEGPPGGPSGVKEITSGSVHQRGVPS